MPIFFHFPFHTRGDPALHDLKVRCLLLDAPHYPPGLHDAAAANFTENGPPPPPPLLVAVERAIN